jgi:hypothetical protein
MLSPVIVSAAASETGLGQEKRPVTMAGILDVLVLEDFERGRSETAYFMREQAGKRFYELKFNPKAPGHLQTGQRVTVRGRAEGRKIWVEALEEKGTTASEPQALTSEATSPAERRAVVLMVDLVDAKASASYTPDQIAANMWTGDRSVAGLYDAASIGQLTFPFDTDGDAAPDVFGPFEIDFSAQGCNYYDWAYAAEAAAEAAGIDLSRYQHRIFILPHWRDLPDCQWSGVANVGCGTFCRTWVAEGEAPMVYAHELGHNLGMAHAGTDPENDGQMNAVYGDYSDPMGLSRDWHLFNAAHADQMGWYGAFSGSTATVAASGIYDIKAIGSDPFSGTEPHILKIEKPDTSEFYYLSYRQPFPDGYDDSLSDAYTQGVNIHRYCGSGYGYTSFITSLADLEGFTDDVNGISITQLGSTGDTVTVEITMGGDSPVYDATAPAVTLSPASLLVQKGSAAGYGVSVTNQDAAGCPTTTFALSCPEATAGTVSPASLWLAPGETGNATLQVDTSAMVDGVHLLEIQVADTDGLEPHHATPAAATAAITVDGTPPDAPTGLAGAADADGAIQLTWNASVDALSGVVSYSVYRDGVPINSTAAAGYTDNATAAGATYTYTVAAVDGVGNASVPSDAVVVTLESGGDEAALHVGDLDGEAMPKKSKWWARVTITVHDGRHLPVARATVIGTWSGGASGDGSCLTGGDGRCTVDSGEMHKNIAGATFTISSVAEASRAYLSGSNHDPEGDSTGTAVTVPKP